MALQSENTTTSNIVINNNEPTNPLSIVPQIPKGGSAEINININTDKLKKILLTATVNFILFRLQGIIFGGAVRDYFIRKEYPKDIDVYVKSVNNSCESFKNNFGNSMVKVEILDKISYSKRLICKKVSVTLCPFIIFPEMKQLSMPSLSIDLVQQGSDSNMTHDFDINLFSVCLKNPSGYRYPPHVKGEFHIEPLWINKIRTQYFDNPENMMIALDNIKNKHFNHITHYIQYPIPNKVSYNFKTQIFHHIIKVAVRTLKKIEEGWTTDISNCPFLHKNITKRECPICSEIHPYESILPCSHNFCINCLYNHVNGKIKFSMEESSHCVKIQCPTCRYELIDVENHIDVDQNSSNGISVRSRGGRGGRGGRGDRGGRGGRSSRDNRDNRDDININVVYMNMIGDDISDDDDLID